MINSIFNLNNYFFNVHSLPYFISGFLIFAESIFIFFQNRKSRLNASFAVSAFFAGVWLTGVGFIYSSLSEQIALIWSNYYSWLGIIFITPAVYMFSIAWVGLRLKENKKSIFFNFAFALMVYIICFSSNYLVDGMWPYKWGFYPKAGSLEFLFIIWFYSLMILTFRNFIISYRKEAISIKKKQTRLVIIAFIFGFMGSIDFVPNFGFPLYTFAAISVLFFSTIIVYTIIQYKLMEIETVIHKTIAWLLTSAALLAPILILLYFTKPFYVNLSSIGSLIYFAALFMCFIFFMKTLQPRVDHFFQKGKFNLENVLNKFANELVHLKNLEELVSKITDTIIDAIFANKVTILLYNDKLKELATIGSIEDSLKANLQIDRNSPFLKWLSKNDRVLVRESVELDPRCEPVRRQAREYFQIMDTIVCVPLVLNETLIGLINLGKKTNLKPYNSYDLRFLSYLKNQSTIAISNSLVYDRVEELVRIRTEELTQTQKQLVQAEKLATVGTLAGGVAHEINNPLAAILTNAQMLLMDAKKEEDKESLILIEDAAKRCRNIVQKLMIYSRKPLGGREIKDADLEKALNNVVSFLSYQLSQENIKLNIRLEKPPFIIKGCQNELEQVFTNLILNAKDAIKHAKKSGQIDILMSRSNNKIIIKVTDDGIGIAKENLSKIFDPFFTTKDVGKGTGLGLSICQSIAEEHQGTIAVESIEGKGATFIIKFPA